MHFELNKAFDSKSKNYMEISFIKSYENDSFFLIKKKKGGKCNLEILKRWENMCKRKTFILSWREIILQSGFGQKRNLLSVRVAAEIFC